MGGDLLGPFLPVDPTEKPPPARPLMLAEGIYVRQDLCCATFPTIDQRLVLLPGFSPMKLVFEFLSGLLLAKKLFWRDKAKQN